MRKILFLLFMLSIASHVQSQSWNLIGNTGTNSSTNFIGTTDNQSLMFRVNNLRAGMIHVANGSTSFGLQALLTSTEGVYNTAIGNSAMLTNTSGAYNTSTGAYSLYSNTTGLYNQAYGAFALYSTTTGVSNIGIGYAAQYNLITAKENVAIGTTALYSNKGASLNVAIGARSLYYNTGGSANIAIGSDALYNNQTGSLNIAIGTRTLLSNTTGGGNVAIGDQCLVTNTTGNDNIVLGRTALFDNTNGNSNVAIGFDAAHYNNTGKYNIAIGTAALYRTSNSQGNTALGFQTGYNYDMGYYNTLIGAYCDVNAAGRYNCVTLGQGMVCTANSQARIGNAATTSIGGYVGWSNISDGRFKKDVQQNVKGLEFIMKLQPVTYHLDISSINKKLSINREVQQDPNMKKAIGDKEKMLYSGFIAQDVEKAASEAGYDFSGVDKPKDQNDLYGLRYAEFVVPLVKGMQEQQQIINELIKQNANLLKRVSALEKGNGIASPAIEEFYVWPNPSYDKVFISITATVASSAIIKLFDSKGALVKQQAASVITGDNQLNMDISTLVKGMYVLSAEWSNGRIKKTARIVK